MGADLANGNLYLILVLKAASADAQGCKAGKSCETKGSILVSGCASLADDRKASMALPVRLDKRPSINPAPKAEPSPQGEARLRSNLNLTRAYWALTRFLRR